MSGARTVGSALRKAVGMETHTHSSEMLYVLQIEQEGKGSARLLETTQCHQEPQMLNAELHDAFSLLSFGLILV